MDTKTNKRLMRDVFAALADGNGGPFIEAMAEDFTWIIAGVETDWAGAWRGKQVVREKLLGPLFERFADTYTSTARSFTAEEDRVVVEFRGKVTTKAGLPYANHYCYVCRFGSDGKLTELTEYADTALMNRALGRPEHPPAELD